MFWGGGLWIPSVVRVRGVWALGVVKTFPPMCVDARACGVGCGVKVSVCRKASARAGLWVLLMRNVIQGGSVDTGCGERVVQACPMMANVSMCVLPRIQDPTLCLES